MVMQSCTKQDSALLGAHRERSRRPVVRYAQSLSSRRAYGEGGSNAARNIARITDPLEEAIASELGFLNDIRVPARQREEATIQRRETPEAWSQGHCHRRFGYEPVV